MLRMIKEILKEKICNKCHKHKPLSEFDKDTAYKDGFKHICKECKKKEKKALMDRWARERENRTDRPTEKECKNCHQIKPINAFGKDKYYKIGISNFCKDCKKQRQQKMKEKWIQNRALNINVPQEKICRSCGQLLPRTYFTYNEFSKDGLNHICKSCVAQQRKQKKLLWRALRLIEKPVTHKICPICNRDLPVSAYYIIDGWKDGMSFYCKECTLSRHKFYIKRWDEERKKVKLTIHEKECIICHRLLPVNSFNKNKFWKDGFSAVCIECERKRKQEYIERWRKERNTSTKILTEQKCIKCHRILPITFFSANKKSKKGLSSECRECTVDRRNSYFIKWEKERQKLNEDTFSLFPSFEKKCPKCGKVLVLSNFYLTRRKKDGLNSICKECSRKMSKQFREKIKAIPKTIFPAEKICKKCERVLPYAAFTRNNSKRDGLNPICRECKNKIFKEYISRPGVHEKMIKNRREHNKIPEVRERQRKWARKYQKRPNVKQRRAAYYKVYNMRPEIKERRKKYSMEYKKKKKAKAII
jgi:hypothetical protein